MEDGRPVERAAGGVVIRVKNGAREVLLIDDAYGRVTFPKGHVEKGETWEAAALREIHEETGIEARILGTLGRVEYDIERNHQPIRKQVRLFLLEAIDETAEPRHQIEEVAGAYYLPFQEAMVLHERKGYTNWSFVLAKANVMWEWHEQRLEAAWRHLPEKTTWEELAQAWARVEPWVLRLREVVQQEVQTVAPQIYGRLADASTHAVTDPQGRAPEQGEVKLPVALPNEAQSLQQAIEHTLLKAEANELDIERLVDEALEHGFRAVCVNPQYAYKVSQLTSDSSVIPCVVVGFPLGAIDIPSLQAQVETVVAVGAKEVDMVVPVGSMCEDDIWTVFRHIEAVVKVAHEGKGRVKVILETHFLYPDQLAKGCLLAVAAGADFVKTSTGFAPTGARVADVALMKTIVGNRAGVKASGGIRTRQQALSFLKFGASRLGTSSGVLIVR